MISKFSQAINSVWPRLQGMYAALFVSSASVIFTSAVATALVMGVRHAGLLQAQELYAYDQFIQWRGDEGSDPRLLIVAITEDDIQQQKKWPLPDAVLAQALAKLEQQQPRVIGLDLYRDLPFAPGTTELNKRLKESDRIIAVCKVSDTSGNSGIAPPAGVPDSRVGFSDLLIDSGGTLRRTLLFLNPPAVNRLSGQKPHLCQDTSAGLYSFSLRLALNYLKSEKIQPTLTSSEELKLGSKVFKRLESNSGSYQNVNAAGYQILLNYRSPRRIAPQVSLTELLTDKVDPNLIKNRIVIIGAMSDGVKDFFYTPYSSGQDKDQEMSGVMIHAQAVSQILSAVLDNRPLFWYWSNWGEAVWIGVWSVFGGTLAWKIRHPLRFGLGSGVALGGLLVVCFGFFSVGAWIPLVPSALTFMTAAGSVVILDRFNKAGYTKAIYDRLKNPFKVNVEIDQSKRERQVAKITQSEYFQDLQKKGRELRTKKTQVSPDSTSEASNDIREPKKSRPTSGTLDKEYLQQMQNKVKESKKRGSKSDE